MQLILDHSILILNSITMTVIVSKIIWNRLANCYDV